MEIIPAIDIIDGRCVRLKKGNFSDKTVYHDDPVSVALTFRDNGLTRLHLVDLDGAREGRIVNSRILKTIFEKTGLVIDFGGGIRSDSDVELAFQSGAAMITAGSTAVKDPKKVFTWIEKYGPDKIILGADVRNGNIVFDAWEMQSDQNLFTYIEKFMDKGIRKIICTDTSKDGIMQGPALKLYSQLKFRFREAYIIASGGISSPGDIEELEIIGINGVIIGKAIYERYIEFKDLEKYLK
jgi:phosphoribosylformimino-5-aminoimidazole carboxamide ribotide isomerase